MPEFTPPTFVRIRTGLLEEKHVKAMGGGSPLVIYLYLQARVRFRGEHAGVTWEPYSHAQAAKDLGLKPGAVRGWFQALRAGGYIETRQLQYGLEVSITKYGQGAPESAPSAPLRVRPVAHPEPSRVRPGAQADGSRVRSPAQQGAPPMTQGAPENAPSDAGIKESRAEQENKRTREGVSRERARESGEDRDDANHTPDSVRIYCQVRQTSVTKTQADLIARVVPESEEGLAAWRRAVEAVEANGIGKANVKCALDWFDRGIPERYRLPTPKSEQVAPAGPPPLPVFTPEQEAASDAARERLKLQLGRIGSGPVSAARREAAAPSFERLRQEALERAERYGVRSDDGGSAA